MAGKDGTLVAPSIAEGKLTVHQDVDPALPARPRPIGDGEIWSNETRQSANYCNLPENSFDQRGSSHPILDIDRAGLVNIRFIQENHVTEEKFCNQ